MSKRQPVEFDDMFPEDIEQYYTLFIEYTQLNPENYTQAYNLAVRSLALADRWNDIMTNAKKISNAKSINKTDFSKYCHGKYRAMHLIHEHCRSIWKTGEDEMRVKSYIKGRRD